MTSHNIGVGSEQSSEMPELDLKDNNDLEMPSHPMSDLMA